MEIYGNGWLEQRDKSAQKYRCRKWNIVFRTELGRRSKFFVGSYKEALAAKDAFATALMEDRSLSNLSFEEYSERWLKWRSANADLSPNTKQKDRDVVDILQHWFGKYKMSQITPPLIKDILIQYSSPSGRAYSGTTKNYHFIKFNQIMQSAVEDQIIGSNPYASIPLPKIDTKEKRALSKTEFAEYVKCLEKEPLDGREIAIYLMLYLGLRRQEALALMWQDVDLKNRQLHIKRAYKNADGSIGDPKSRAGKRTLPIPYPLQEKLQELHDGFPEGEITPYVCFNTRYQPLTHSALKKWHERYEERYGLPHISFHELRHTNLTIVARNMNEFDLQRYAGWSSLAPARIYIHADNESLKNSIDGVFTK